MAFKPNPISWNVVCNAISFFVIIRTWDLFWPCESTIKHMNNVVDDGKDGGFDFESDSFVYDNIFLLKEDYNIFCPLLCYENLYFN